MTEFSFDALRRAPDVEADNLFAVDASDRLILDEANGALEDTVGQPGTVVVIGDNYGALTLGAAAVLDLHGIRVQQDARSSELALAANARRVVDIDLSGRYTNHPLGRELLEGATVVLVQLPRSLAALDDIARAIAAYAHPDVVVYAGGRVKHMTPAMNDVLAASFDEVTATLARQKSRVLVARKPREGVGAALHRREYHADLDLWVYASGNAFAGTKIDIGTRLLIEHLGEMAPDARIAIDLGCGTGVLAALVARARGAGGVRVIATDQSEAAVESARETMAANGLADLVEVVRDDALGDFDDDSADLIVLNPPFHVGSTVHAGIALKLFEAAGRVLRPGGELWTVFNSHLSYRAALQRAVGPTRQVDRNPKFTVMVSTGR
ncbi:class I SAM-dependent methyltransferase [Herbiconiux ginsengi]|uniref:16S rRNA m(2)G 1207 methyltransferase /23S rRNA m(2)G-1835 methyltransferase n=1 Tax=Herbiconiux ginsengi TaxID=381665 RepID=A0A1H3ME58_9MICO|nr:methyltransferase [Herbiconiux ginsengi]SDY75011.1 16S rRNA m(2)G 1207 methyltransferase /23S rRNA m(2)G-1835 methyltransferase [Herbiconiux ginsengi]